MTCIVFTETKDMNGYTFHKGDVAHFDDKGRLHSKAGPALVRANGTIKWYSHGEFQSMSMDNIRY